MRALGWIAWVVVAGCAHRSPFPSAAQLKELTLKPKPTKALPNLAINVPRFELKGPFENTAPHETSTPWGAFLARSAPGRFEPDGALACAARELSRFGL